MKKREFFGEKKEKLISASSFKRLCNFKRTFFRIEKKIKKVFVS